MSKKIDLVLSFDTTGSMSGAIADVRQNLTKFCAHLFGMGHDLRVSVIAHGDYGDGENTYQVLPFCTEAERVIKFVREAKNTSGGDADECYELVLYKAGQMDWRADADKIMILFGDADPHKLSEYQRRAEWNPGGGRDVARLVPRDLCIDWQSEVVRLKDRGVVLFGVQCVSTHTGFWTSLGTRFMLRDFASSSQMILAAVHAQTGGDEAVRSYAQTLEKAGTMTADTRAAVAMLLNKGTVSKGGLKGVAAGEFVIMDVTERVKIEDLIKRQGLVFEPGNLFYEWTKRERTIQSGKQVVAQRKDKPDEFYTGDRARTLAGLPTDGKTSAANVTPPESSAYVFYVRSDSMNRVVLPGTKVLYKAKVGLGS